jgi:4-amino-4-deoxy-L-arabinose transferase-like glycosyltransferase
VLYRLRELAKAVPPSAWAILVAAFALRVFFVLASHDYSPQFDEADYDRVARSIVHDGRYPASIFVADGGPSAFTPPGYPLFLSAVYALSGDSWTAARVAQVVLGTLVVALIGLLARELWGNGPALICMGIGAMGPFLFFPETALLSEPLFNVFVLSAVLAALQVRRSQDSRGWAIATGLLAGAAIVTRTNGVVILLPLLAATLPGFPRPSRSALVNATLVIAGAGLVIAPWVVRNAISTHSFVPLSTRLGYGLQRTYNDVSRTDPVHPSTPHGSPVGTRITHRPGITEVEAEREMRSAAFRYMKEHPGYVAQTIVRNTLRAAQLKDVGASRLSTIHWPSTGIPGWEGYAAILSFYPVAVLALIGLGTRHARRVPKFVWGVPVLLFLSVILMADGRVRYRTSVDPFLILLAGAAASQAWAWLKTRSDSGSRVL